MTTIVVSINIRVNDIHTFHCKLKLGGSWLFNMGPYSRNAHTLECYLHVKSLVIIFQVLCWALVKHNSSSIFQMLALIINRLNSFWCLCLGTFLKFVLDWMSGLFRNFVMQPKWQSLTKRCHKRTDHY
jgi:hypothetical protein